MTRNQIQEMVDELADLNERRANQKVDDVFDAAGRVTAVVNPSASRLSRCPRRLFCRHRLACR
jgi:hypothetical protein